jgi:hypothetical protein
VSRELEDSIDDNPHDEETDDNGEDNEDADPAEPSLGILGLTDQEDWSMGDRRDLEDEHDGAEPSEDDEPSRGSFDGLMMDQEVCYLVSGVSTDAELDDADLSGIGEMPFADHELLDFSLFDLARRVKASRAMLFEGDRPVTVKPVLSIVRDQA